MRFLIGFVLGAICCAGLLLTVDQPVPIVVTDCNIACPSGCYQDSGTWFHAIEHTTKAALMAYLETLPTGTLALMGYVGDDGDTHVLTHADLHTQTPVIDVDGGGPNSHSGLTLRLTDGRASATMLSSFPGQPWDGKDVYIPRVRCEVP